MIEVRDISDFNEYLESLLVQNECDDLESKSAAGGFPGSFWETYSAFANTDGGTIMFRMQERSVRFFLKIIPSAMVTNWNWNQTRLSQAQAQLPTSVLVVVTMVGWSGKTKTGKHWMLYIGNNGIKNCIFASEIWLKDV